MSSREKRLLFLLLGALFVVVNLFGIRWLGQQRESLRRSTAESRVTLETAAFADQQREAVQDEIEWLAQYEPEPKVGELVPGQLEVLVNTGAKRWNLTVNRPKILPTVAGDFYDRARFQLSVTGQESALWRWLAELHNPNQFRAVTELRLSPNREDDTLIDATVLVEEWFVPAVTGPETAENTR